MDSLRLTRAQIVRAVGNDQPTVRVFERLVAGAVPIRVATSSTALTAADRVVVMSGGGTATLPRASDVVGQMLTVKRGASGAVDVAATNGETIDGVASYALGLVGQSVTVVSDGVRWWIV
jgi:hypothetical protein